MEKQSYMHTTYMELPWDKQPGFVVDLELQYKLLVLSVDEPTVVQVEVLEAIVAVPVGNTHTLSGRSTLLWTLISRNGTRR